MAASLTAVAALAGSSTALAQDQAGCAEPRSLEVRRQLDKAKEAYLKVLAADQATECAVDGLTRVTNAQIDAEALCDRAARAKKANRPDVADELYAAALAKDVGSECARKGLTAPAKTSSAWKDFWGGVGDAVDFLPKIPDALAGLIGLLALVATVFWLVWRRRPSLVVRAFSGEAVDLKVGAGIAALVEERLLSVARIAERTGDVTYDLDLVVADVDLLAGEDDLSDAVTGMSEMPQLQLAAAVIAFMERISFKRRLAIGGELLPEGPKGHGIATVLYRRNAIRARAGLWEAKVKSWMPPEDGGAPAAPAQPAQPPVPVTGPPEEPGALPYYRLAPAVAAWGQYEAGRELHAEVDMLTVSAESFALVSLGVARHRAGELQAAAECYADALTYDPDNVAALINLARIVSQTAFGHLPAVLLVARANAVLRRRHEPSTP